MVKAECWGILFGISCRFIWSSRLFFVPLYLCRRAQRTLFLFTIKTHTQHYEQDMENDSSGDQLHHHPPVRGRGRECRDVEAKSNEAHEKGRLQSIPVRLCGAAHREQHRARGVSGHRD